MCDPDKKIFVIAIFKIDTTLLHVVEPNQLTRCTKSWYYLGGMISLKIMLRLVCTNGFELPQFDIQHSKVNFYHLQKKSTSNVCVFFF